MAAVLVNNWAGRTCPATARRRPGDGPKIVIAGKRENWPGGPRTLTLRDRTREPNGRSLWFGAELDPDGSPGVVSGSRRWPAAGCGRRRPAPVASAWSTPFLAWMTPDRQLGPELRPTPHHHVDRVRRSRRACER